MKKNTKRSTNDASTRGVLAPAANSIITRQGTTRLTLSHTERVATVITPSAGDTALVNDYVINPGNRALFPWGFAVASCFEYYKFRALRFRYVPSCGTSQAGQVLLAIDYDPQDIHPDDVDALSNMDGCVSAPLWTGITAVASNDGLSVLPRHYVGPGSGLRTDDCGRLYVAVVSSTVATAAGYLWVDYTVDLYAPQSPDPEIVQVDFTVKSGAALPKTVNTNPNRGAGEVSWSDIFDATVTTAGRLIKAAYAPIGSGAEGFLVALPRGRWGCNSNYISGNDALPSDWLNINPLGLLAEGSDNYDTSVRKIDYRAKSNAGTAGTAFHILEAGLGCIQSVWNLWMGLSVNPTGSPSLFNVVPYQSWTVNSADSRMGFRFQRQPNLLVAPVPIPSPMAFKSLMPRKDSRSESSADTTCQFKTTARQPRDGDDQVACRFQPQNARSSY